MFWELSFPSFDEGSCSSPYRQLALPLQTSGLKRVLTPGTLSFHFSEWLIGGTWLNAWPPVLWHPLRNSPQPGRLDLALVLDSWGCHCGWRECGPEKGQRLWSETDLGLSSDGTIYELSDAGYIWASPVVSNKTHFRESDGDMKLGDSWQILSTFLSVS